jgi:hypothetical protein
MSKPVFKATGQSIGGNHKIDVKAGDFIFREQELGTEMYIVHEGQVEILQEATNEGSRRLTLLEKGDFFGEMSLLDDMPRNASARAVTDAKLLRINGSTFVQMLRRDPEIAIRIMRKFSRRLRDMDRLLKEALGESTGSSLAHAVQPVEDPEEERAVGPERLIHDKSGMEFFIAQGEETSIGRRDPVTGINPDIDLTPVDSQRSISRRHSKIYRRGGKFYVAEEIGTMNGTYVNGTRLETGVPAEIEPGDEVRFGMVVTHFKLD